ncbi:MAG: electron transfer flavoprotein subunit alpha/FixB family protein [Alphaproteobacteria bacterium]|nr:electron transfer flavoprotein subunit alpha/FixB family protein [Alphaproteobacteria bacterium]MBF0129067.1 electron transfer flavoprotein subunit alpha/FixB family protein [Alphaproteobacteria bacterium]
MSVLVVAEHDNGSLKPTTLRTVTAALQLGEDVHVLVAGHGCAAVAGFATRIVGVKTVFLADDPRYAHFLAEPLALLVKEMADRHPFILAPSSTFGKNFMPRLAALLDVQPIADIIAVKSPDTFVRPIYAGNALATVQSKDFIKVITVRGSAFEPAPSSGGLAAIDIIPPGPPAGGAVFVSGELSRSVRPELTAARVVVSGGRGMQGAENFKLLDGVADRLGGAVGASRAAVDAGYAPNDFQVGQTGKIVAPDLYIAVGISGAIQHLAGMKDSKVIVAVNKDPEAPIFQVADYGLVGDLFQVLPELAAELDK